MILIDAIYLNSFGGKTILELFIKKILVSNIKYHFILDTRLKSNWLKRIKSNNYTLINASHTDRRYFYLKNINRFSSILCLSNIPPPTYVSIKTYIFFHNILLLNPFNHPVSFKSQIINFIKYFYIKYYNQNGYYWIVQTPYIYKLLRKNLIIDLDQVFIYPIIEEELLLPIVKKIANDFVYVSSGVSSHKNHIRLIKAFIEAANKTDTRISSCILLYTKKTYLKFVFPQNLKIVFHGIFRHYRCCL